MQIFFFTLGMCLGSFLNVVAQRIPKGESFITGRSRCSKCGHQLSWWQLIPILSFIILGAKCAVCGSKISWRYPLVELATGLLYVLLFINIGIEPILITAMIFTSILIVISLIDYDYKIIPNKVVFFGIVIGIPANLLAGGSSWQDMLLGALVGGSLMLLIAILSRGGMGGGDLKFTVMLGIYLGWQYTLETIFLASLIGAIVGIVLMLIGRANRKTALPFGPFLAISAFVLYLSGTHFNSWYWRLFV